MINACKNTKIIKHNKMKVSLSINPESTSPGEEVLVRVNASQDSCVLLSAIDQSMLLLSAGNEINHDMVFFLSDIVSSLFHHL